MLKKIQNLNFKLPIEGDLKGYLSGRSTLTFQTPPSYGAETESNRIQTIGTCNKSKFLHNFGK